jgi:hypothetical protein
MNSDNYDGALCPMLSGAGSCTLPKDHAGAHAWASGRRCRYEGCERAARPDSPYCNADFAIMLDAAYAPSFWPTDAEINQMHNERARIKS